ncbi:alpha/beta hydrolase [Patescibacteria group bacterium]|nr:alpha/beta hydrolase [Patescibacteria group bacterium]
MEFPEMTRSNNEIKDLINYKYEVDGVPIKVTCREFTPSNKEFPPNKAIIFLPGWLMGASANSGEKLSQSFADSSGEKTYSIVSRAESIIPDSLFKEAEAISRFIEDNGLKEATIGGHSEGGSKAIYLVSLLQDKIKIKGLILLDTPSLFNLEGLVGKFAKDTFVYTLPHNIKDQYKGLKRGQTLTKAEIAKSLLSRTGSTIGAGIDIMKGVAKELKLSYFDYLERLKSQIQEMERKNSSIPRIKVPVVIISGAKDPLSPRDKIVPKAEEDKAVQDYLKSIESDLSETDPTAIIRGEYLKENLFLESPYVRAIFPEKFGHHGLPLFRPESVAKVSLYLLERYSRNPSSFGKRS